VRGGALVLTLVCSLAMGAIASAEGSGGSDLSAVGEEPLWSIDTPAGAIEYHTGRGLRLGRSGLTLGGFGTLNVEREEGEPTLFLLEGLNLLASFDPVDWFHAFSEVEFGDLAMIESDRDHVSSDANVDVERLYGDLVAGDQAAFRLGKFLTPVGRWNLIPVEPLRWTTSEPVLLERSFDDHLTGGMFYGSVYPRSNVLSYSLFAQFLPPLDGDSMPWTSDHSVGGRLEYGDAPGAWSAGASFLASEREGRWNYLGGLDGVWRRGPFELMGELAVSDGALQARRLWGFYLQGVFELCPSFYLVGRYEHFSPFGPERTVDLGDLGVAWIPWPFLHIKADYRVATRQSDLVARGLQASISVLF
jgi:hypothetical protein